MMLYVWRIAVLAAILGLWEFASGRWIQPFFISRPSRIATVFWSWVTDGSLFFHAGITASEAFAGFLAGGVVGVVVGLILGRSTRLADIIHPFITAFYSLPKLALAPLFILWFGIGMNMKIAFTDRKSTRLNSSHT